MTERRKYIRIDSVFPVQFKLHPADSQGHSSAWQQGFTNNIGIGGLCLEVNNLSPQLQAALGAQGIVRLSLAIEMPLGRKPVYAQAKVAWAKELDALYGKYLIGLSYENIPPVDNRRIMRFARTQRLFAPVAVSVIVFLAFSFIVSGFIGFKLAGGNRALIDQLIAIIQQSTVVKQKVKQINKEKEDLEIKIQTLKAQLANIEAERSRAQGSMAAMRLDQVDALADKFNGEKNAVQEALLALQNKENVYAEELLLLDKKKATLEKANLDNMHQWLKARQDPRTGLVAGFDPGCADINCAPVYDQSLAIIAYAYFADFYRAKKTIGFFNSKAKKLNGDFFDLYSASTGKPLGNTPAILSNSDIWLGIAILQYTQKSSDRQYLKLAQSLAAKISGPGLDLQGSSRGREDRDILSYAFFNMLCRFAPKEEYLAARDKALKNVVSRSGKEDMAMFADTYVWSIAAIGAAKLQELGINPDRAIEAVENNYCIETEFLRPDGKVTQVKGFVCGRPPEKRTGAVSAEWTARVALSCRILADFYYQKNMVAKARSYEFKADSYLSSLANMAVYGERRTCCLPYSSAGDKEKSGCSVAATVFTIFAYYKFDPLQL